MLRSQRDTQELQQKFDEVQVQVIQEIITNKRKIKPTITVVWQQSDLSCNTRASSFCSPENVGEQGIQLIIVLLINDGVKRKDPTSLPNVSDDLFLEPKQEKQQPNNTEPRTVHRNDLHPVNQRSTGWVGWELFDLGSLIRYISPKWQLIKLEPRSEQRVNSATEKLIHKSLPFQTED